MRCADFGEPPPSDLLLYWWCGDTRLPEAGGVLAQDYEQFRRMMSVGNIYKTVMRLRNMHGKQIHNLTTAERRMIASLREMGLL